MPCVTPIHAYRFFDHIPSGYREVSLRAPPPNYPFRVDDVMLPCGKCIECKKRYTRDWALRMAAECQLHDANSFITFTYDDGSLHYTKSGLPTLYYKDMQDFMKRLRRHFDSEEAKALRLKQPYIKPRVSYYYCGEYGSQTQRPHYHMILFGWFPPVADRYVVDSSENTVFESPLLEKIWKHGRVQVQHVNFDACAYVAGYVEKKRKDWDDYQKALYYGDRTEEKSFCSRRPAIGKRYYEKYKFDMFPADHFVSDGFELPVPQYFYKLLNRDADNVLNPVKRVYDKSQHVFVDKKINFNRKDLDLYETVRKSRLDNLQDYTPERLEARRVICESKAKLRRERNQGL